MLYHLGVLPVMYSPAPLIMGKTHLLRTKMKGIILGDWLGSGFQVNCTTKIHAQI
jgi:hypothetical protein